MNTPNKVKRSHRVTTGVLHKTPDGPGHWGRLLIDGTRPEPFSIGLFGGRAARIVWMH